MDCEAALIELQKRIEDAMAPLVEATIEMFCVKHGRHTEVTQMPQIQTTGVPRVVVKGW